ncbi:hypothetical protein [Photorhabdus laumondii]|uniref:hypothetical protein n=1 Tax=Photorhabdus laumondii TaxID=2218628 RepID=UPI0025B09C3A|nr:hypothetical protein [Photorhabdus laumondii]
MKYTSVRIEEAEDCCHAYAEWTSYKFGQIWKNRGLLCTAYDVKGGVVVCDKFSHKPIRVLHSMNDFRRYIEDETGVKLPSQCQ